MPLRGKTANTCQLIKQNKTLKSTINNLREGK